MRRNTAPRQPLKLNDTAREMIDKLTAETGSTTNVTASRLIELGMYTLTNVKTKLDKTAHEIQVAVAAHAIMQDAIARVKELKNQKPR